MLKTKPGVAVLFQRSCTALSWKASGHCCWRKVPSWWRLFYTVSEGTPSFFTLSRTELNLRSTAASPQILLEHVRKHLKIFPFCLQSTWNYTLQGKTISLSLFSVRLLLRFSELLSDRVRALHWFLCELDIHENPQFRGTFTASRIVTMFGLVFLFLHFLAILNPLERQICFLFFKDYCLHWWLSPNKM